MEETVVVNGVARKVRKVQLELDATTMINLQAGKAYIAAGPGSKNRTTLSCGALFRKRDAAFFTEKAKGF